MAYKPINKYYRVLKVQEIFLKYSKEGVTNVFIYENYIKHQFNISDRTFYSYLGINAKHELKKLGLPVQTA